MKQLIHITKLRKALKRFWNIHFVRRSFIKYDIKICHFSEVDISEDNVITKIQNEGWEICGAISVPQTRTWCAEKSITIPFKRRQNYA
jgi:hypothetical protein